MSAKPLWPQGLPGASRKRSLPPWQFEGDPAPQHPWRSFALTHCRAGSHTLRMQHAGPHDRPPPITRLRVSIRVPVGRPSELAAFVARYEEAGFGGVGIHDHPSSGRDTYLATR